MEAQSSGLQRQTPSCLRIGCAPLGVSLSMFDVWNVFVILAIAVMHHPVTG